MKLEFRENRWPENQENPCWAKPVKPVAVFLRACSMDATLFFCKLKTTP
jgi:hypothetical protein